MKEPNFFPVPNQKRNPIIGITIYGREEDGKFSIPGNYLDSVRQAGGVPILLAPGECAIETILEIVDGLIFAGGEDIDPKHYNGNTENSTVKDIDAERDAFELSLARKVLQTNLPVLGICRGSQLLTVATGGTLIEHLPDEVDNSILHRGEKSKEVEHSVQIKAGSRLANIIGSTEMSVQSKHHQGLRKISDDWNICGSAQDGVIEALEHKTHPWMFAVLWHPEMSPNDIYNQRIFAAFVKAACKTGC